MSVLELIFVTFQVGCVPGTGRVSAGSAGASRAGRGPPATARRRPSSAWTRRQGSSAGAGGSAGDAGLSLVLPGTILASHWSILAHTGLSLVSWHNTGLSLVDTR